MVITFSCVEMLFGLGRGHRNHFGAFGEVFFFALTIQPAPS